MVQESQQSNELRIILIIWLFRCVPEHMKVVPDLIAMRGGIEKIQLPGLAEVIVR
jgi:hypothetical protein